MRKLRLLSHLAFSTLVVLGGALAILVLIKGLSWQGILKGFILGLLVSAGNFWLLSRDIRHSRYAEREQLERWLLARFLMRYVLIGLGFAFCLIYPQFHIVGFLTGFVAFQLWIFWNMFHWRK